MVTPLLIDVTGGESSSNDCVDARGSGVDCDDLVMVVAVVMV